MGWLVFRGLFADMNLLFCLRVLKVPTCMAGKGVTVNGGQFNEHI